MSNLNPSWRKMAEDHWKEHLPKLYRHLKKEGELEQALDDAVRKTTNEMIETEDAGASRDQAWEEIRERYLILPPEKEEPSPEDEEQSPEDNPNQAYLDLISEIWEARMDLCDEVILPVDTKVFTFSRPDLVLVRWPGPDGRSLLRRGDVWEDVSDVDWTVGELMTWDLVTDTAEASKLLKEAMSASLVKPADSASAENAAS